MHLRAGIWRKKTIARLPEFPKCVEVILLARLPQKGETPPLRSGASVRSSVSALT